MEKTLKEGEPGGRKQLVELEETTRSRHGKVETSETNV